MSNQLTPTSAPNDSQKPSAGGLQLPPLIETAGERARRKFVEFFLA